MTDESIFAAALAIGSPAERAAFLDRACAGDPALRAEVEALLAAHVADNPLDRPPANLVRTGAYEPEENDGPPAAAVGDRIGPYRLMEQIGEGGFGLVFVAEQTEPVRRKVALKVLKPGMDTKDVVARFEAERQALALMDHPNIARVFDAGSTSTGRPYFVMELVRGMPVTEFCDSQKLSPRDRLALFVQVCHAVQHAHQKGVIHRDLKPSNILVTSHDGVPVPKVIDFGVAKAVGQSLTEKTIYTRFAQMIGTPLYMSPEQAEMSGLDVDTRSDVYALGVLLYELLTGTTPFDRDRFRKAAFDEIRRIIREEEPPRPSTRLSTTATSAKFAAVRGMEPARLSALVRGELDWIVMRCLEKDRNRRYESASGLAKDVQRYLSGDAVEAGPPTLGYRLQKFYRRNRAAVWVVAPFLLLTYTGASGIYFAYQRAVDAEAEAWWQRDEVDAAREREGRRADAEARERSRAEAAERTARTNQSRAESISRFLLTDFLPRPDLDISFPRPPLLVEQLDRAAAAVEHRFASDPASAADIHVALGDAYYASQRFTQSEEQFRLAVRKRTAVYGEAAPETAQVAYRLGHVLWQVGRHADAQATLERAVAVFTATGPAWEADAAWAMEYLGTVHWSLGRARDLVRWYERSLEIRLRLYGLYHLATIRSLTGLPQLYLADGQLDRAESAARQLVSAREQVSGRFHNYTLFEREFLVHVLAERKEYRAAELQMRECLAVREHNAPDEWNTSLARSYLGGLLYRQQVYTESETLLLRGYEGMKAREKTIPSSQRNQLPTAVDRLIDLYTATGKPEEVAKWRAERAKYPEVAPSPRPVKR